MERLTDEILRNKGFEYNEDYNTYTKAIGGRTIICYKPHNNAGYWVCDIWTSYDPVQNNRIVSDEDLQSFIDSTCPDMMVRTAVAPDFHDI